MTLTFEKEKMTKNTVRFTEKLEHDLDTPAMGTIYVSKSALRDLGWEDGKTLTITLSARGARANG